MLTLFALLVLGLLLGLLFRKVCLLEVQVNECMLVKDFSEEVERVRERARRMKEGTHGD